MNERPIDSNEDPAVVARVAALGRIEWLADCDPVVLSRLATHARDRHYAQGEFVVRRGDRVDSLFVLNAGSLEVGITTAAGRHFVTTFLEPDQVFGLIPLLDGGPALHDMVAHDPCEVTQLRGEDVHAALQADFGLQRRVLSMLAARSRRLYVTFADTSLLPLPTRLARLLVSLVAAYGIENRAEGQAIGLRIAQESLAAMLGVTRQRTNTELKVMERAGVVRMAYSRILVIDEAALRALAEESSG